jgi:urease accessory protein
MNRLFLALAAVTLAASPASAHLAPGEHGSFLAGASHPLFGLDHILAMVAVGLWAAMLGGRALTLVPAAFVGTMVVGFALAMAGIGLPFVEPAILASVVVLGLVVAISVRLPAAAGAILVGAFALFHGHAHGGELGTAAALPYLAGFAVSTALLHGAGLGVGLTLGSSRFGTLAARTAGGITVALGFGLAVGAI